MSKAEDRAYECFTNEDVESKKARFGFLLGYHQAEKDNELTWEDMELIYEISCDVFYEQDGNLYSMPKIWEEVLKRFKDFKERKEK